MPGADPRCRAVRASASFTVATTMRKPALRMVEMLFRFSTLASSMVTPAVISKPTSGWFQIGHSSWTANSLDWAMV